MKKSNNKMLSSISSLGSATLLNAILVFIVEVITRNILGPEKYGYWLTISIIFTFIPIFQLGTLNAMNREVPYYIARNENNRVREIRETVFSFIFSFPIVLVLTLFLISIIIFITDIKFEYKIGLLLASLITGFTYLSGYAEMYYKSEQNFKKASKLISIKSISQSIFTLVMVFYIGYPGLYLGMLIALLIEIYTAKGIFPKYKRVNSYNEYKKLIKVGFPILIVGLVWSVMIATDRIIISIFMTPEDLGNYGVGLLVFNAMMLFPQVINQVFYPKIVELVSKENYVEIRKLYWKTNKILALIMGLVVLVGFVILPYFINWFMPEYSKGILAAQVLLVGIYPLTLVGLAACYFNSTNKQKMYLSIQLISIFINILLSVVFLSLNDSITSVSIATSITFIIYFLLMNASFLIIINKDGNQVRFSTSEKITN
ncbi:oligosaccharide flippase family protein [Mesobacillus foraminis]|uniref:lipopolysaccharide biosynthesis protein n=1 Tax=Mesobacillus foraminis TaxID=279826 RepID=UPI001BE64040|nr:oligosaccharide flippase family protein [Mesobacillus foraminis]MBT2756712.1 oligosaccharide flippase family protein [Mesobacillus foraminis]